MASSFGRRIIKLERSAAARSGDRLFVVSGYSRDQHRQQIDALIAEGKATADSLFVCLRRFSEPVVPTLPARQS